MATRGDMGDLIGALTVDGLLDESAEDLYENAPTAYFSSLLDGTLVRVNTTLLRWTGYRTAELVGRKRLHDLLAPGARIYYETHYAPLLQMQGEVREIAVELVRADGSRLPVLMNSIVVRDDNGTARLVRTTAFDASERRRYERELLRARTEAELRARAALALTHIAEGVLLVGEDGEIQLMNCAAGRILGVEPAVTGQPAAAVLPGWGDLAARIRVVGFDEVPAPEVVPLPRPGGEQWLSVSATDAGGAIVYTLRDVTAERQLDQIQSDMIAIVSHELRTPLTGALGAAQTLAARYDDLEDEQRRQFLTMIVEQASRLATILDQILLASRIDTGNLDASSHVFDCREVVDSVVGVIDSDLLQRIVIDAPAPVLIRAELDRLRQVLANLIDNALKYSTGVVRLTVEEHDFFGRLTVSDDGPGIPLAERERIFEKFYRLDPAQRHGVGGTGLGLYIARELVERMDGRIGLLPRDRGTEFFVDLPLGAAAGSS